MAVTSVAVAPSATSAAANDVVISEIMYNPLSDLDSDEFLEITNIGVAPVDIGGWCFSGITVCFPLGQMINSGARLVVSPDAARFQAVHGFAPAAVFTGGLKNSGEKLTLKDAAAATVDTVSFLTADPWPVTPDGLGPSLELIDPTLNNDDGLNWAASSVAGGTAGAANSVAGSGLNARITGVSASPSVPVANQAVTVTATVTGQTANPTMRYRTDFGNEQTTTMTSAGGDLFTATIPGAAAGHLLRYRIEATNSVGTSRLPRLDDSEIYRGVVVANGITSALPVLEWFIADADYNAITSNPTADIIRTAVVAYDGTVYDNVHVNIRGAGTQNSPKPNWKFEMAKNHDLVMPSLVEPVDEFAMQADWSDRSHGRSIISWESYRQAGIVNTQLFPVRTQRNAQFQGLYLYLDLFDGTWRSREGYDDDQFFKSEHGAFDASRKLEEYRWSKKNPADGDFTQIRALLNAIDLSGAAERNYLLANADIPQIINFAVVTAIVQHTDSSSKNFYFSLESSTGRWEVIPWDLDHTYGNTCCNVVSPFVTPAEPQDQTSELMDAILAVPEWRTMYFRRARTLVDQILAPGNLTTVYDTRVGPTQATTVLDFAAWPYASGSTYASQRTALFNAITARRNAFNNDGRVPAAQSATANIVINEIQHSPVGGAGEQFIELYNPSATEAIDLSGWALSDGVVDGFALQIQPGAVILPRGTLVFASDDPTFRASYGATTFVGGRFAGALTPTGTLTLARVDSSVADAVMYGGTDWPQPTAGHSLELVDPASDNNAGASWVLSAGAGTPGRPNGGSTVGTVPGAPTIGNATAGNANATVRWTAPASDGGSPITGYNVTVVNNATNAQVGALRPAGAGASSLVVTGLANGTAYRFRVVAVNAVGPSTPSGDSNAVTPAGASVPGAPKIGNATRGSAGGARTAIARWTPPASTGGSAITGYRVSILRMSGSGAGATVQSTTMSGVLGAGVRQYTATLPTGTNYRFQVAAVNAVGTGALSTRSNNVVPR